MAPPTGDYGRNEGGGLAPHRGTTVLVLGILGLVLSCFILGIIAWVMGSGDLRAMREGRMDRAGEGTTRAGMICGIISVILSILGIVLLFAGILAFPWADAHVTYTNR
jgi:hypothetical protein